MNKDWRLPPGLSTAVKTGLYRVAIESNIQYHRISYNMKRKKSIADIMKQAGNIHLQLLNGCRTFIEQCNLPLRTQVRIENVLEIEERYIQNIAKYHGFAIGDCILPIINLQHQKELYT